MKLEVFFDYACPYCLCGHESLIELLPEFPQIEVEWCPCEAHPRPDRYGMHSDLCARGMMFVRDNGAELMEYHRRMYRAALKDQSDIEDLRVVCDLVADLVDADEMYETLRSDAYTDELEQNNRLAWSTHRFDAVPSFVVGTRQLLSVENIGLTKDAMRRFLSTADI